MNTTIIASKCHKGHVLMISNTTHLIVCKTKSTVNWLITHNFLLLAHLFLHYLVFRKISALTRPQNRKRKSLLDVFLKFCSLRVAVPSPLRKTGFLRGEGAATR